MAHTRPEFRSRDWEQYQQVNRRFADAVAEEASSPDPIVLVQDYHFALLPKYLRQRLPRATILTFWHIPWPNAERFGICPWARELLDGLLGSSIVGFHTQAHCNNFIESVDRYLESRLDRERQSVVQGGRETLVRAYPISIDWPSRWSEGAAPVAECRAAVRRRAGDPARTRCWAWASTASTTPRGSRSASWRWSGCWSAGPSTRGGSASSRSPPRAGSPSRPTAP